MKKLLLTLVACVVALAANAWTVKFTNPNGWEQVAVWAWDSGSNENFTGGTWPGKLMEKGSDGLWTYTGTGNPNKIIFNNNNKGAQTGDLDFVDGATYDLNGPVGAKTYDYTVYFDNTDNWPNVYAYGWGAMGYTGGYPGKKLEKGSDGLYVWTITTTSPNPPVCGGDGFQFNNGDTNNELKTPDIKTYTVGATYYPNGTTTPPSGDKADWYVIGANVDGANWALGTNPMKKTANGVYEWTGSTLGSGFKINNGTWDAATNIGQGDSGAINIGEAYYYYMGDGSGDIEFNNFTTVTDPKIVLDTNNGTITLTGKADLVITIPSTLYIIGDVEGSGWNPTLALQMNGSDGDFYLKNLLFNGNENSYFSFCTAKGTSDDDWTGLGTRYVAPEENTPIAAGQSKEMITNGDKSFMITSGSYDVTVTFNKETGVATVSIEEADTDAVAGIEAENGEAVYFNLQGQKVANPDKGIFVKVVNGKAVKVVK